MLPMQGTQVKSLVRELTPQMPGGGAKKKKKKRSFFWFWEEGGRWEEAFQEDPARMCVLGRETMAAHQFWCGGLWVGDPSE